MLACLATASIAQAPSTSPDSVSVPLTEEAHWQVLQYSRLPPHRIRFSGAGLEIMVDGSAMPLIHPLPRPVPVKSFRVKGRIEGTLRVPAERQGEENSSRARTAGSILSILSSGRWQPSPSGSARTGTTPGPNSRFWSRRSNCGPHPRFIATARRSRMARSPFRHSIRPAGSNDRSSRPARSLARIPSPPAPALFAPYPSPCRA